MEETFIVMKKTPPNGFPSGHLLQNIAVGKLYSEVGRYCRSRQIIDDIGNEVWVSGKVFKKFFKEADK